MRVAFIVYGKLDQRSGGFLYDHHLRVRLEEKGHEVEVISQREGSLLLSILGNFSPLTRQICRSQADLIIIDELNHPSLFAAIRRIRRLGRPVLAIVHHLRSSEKLPPGKRALTSAMERRLLSNVDGFIFNSHHTEKSVKRLLHGKTSISLIVNPAAENKRQAPRKRRAGPLRLLYVGNIIPRKGLEVLIQALIGMDNTDWILDIVGQETLNPHYANICRKTAAFHKRIRFKGRLNDGNLEALWKECHVLVLPSELEGFGIVYLEAMRAGLVPVAGKTGGAGEIIRHGQDGYLVSPGDCTELRKIIWNLIVDDELRLRLAEAAFQRSGDFPSWKVAMDAAVDFLVRFKNQAASG